MFFIINININLYIKMIPGYYINLERSKERRNFMEQTYKILTRIEAYDGNKLDKYTDIILPKKSDQSYYQYACALSHIKAIIHSYNNGDEEALIYEDDISDEYSYKWCESIESIVLNKPEDCECLQLFCSNSDPVLKMAKLSTKYCRWKEEHYSTSVYYINRPGMKKIFDKYFKNGKIDLSLTLRNYVADCAVIYEQLVTYSYTKPLFINKLYKSTIAEKVPYEEYIHKFLKDYFERCE